MNHTIEDSKKSNEEAIVVMMPPIFLENGKSEVQKEEAKDSIKIVESRFSMNQEFDLISNSAEVNKFKESLPGYEEVTENRMTQTAYERKLKEKNNTNEEQR